MSCMQRSRLGQEPRGPAAAGPQRQGRPLDEARRLGGALTARANSSGGSWCRRLPNASVASVWASRSPAFKAARIRRPRTPQRAVTTLERLTCVSSNTWGTRVLAGVRVGTRHPRAGQVAPDADPGGGTTLGRMSPCASHAALQGQRRGRSLCQAAAASPAPCRRGSRPSRRARDTPSAPRPRGAPARPQGSGTP